MVKAKRKYVARPGIEPRTPDLRVRCPTDCATWPGAVCTGTPFMVKAILPQAGLELWTARLVGQNNFTTGAPNSGI